MRFTTTFVVLFLLLLFKYADAADEVHNEYFERLAKSKHTIAARSYRNQKAIDADLHGRKPTLHSYDSQMDAARIVVGESRGSIQQIRCKLREKITTGKLQFTWDFRYHPEWKSNLAGVQTQKAFMLASRAKPDSRRLEVRSRYSLARHPAVAQVDVRPYHTGSRTGAADRIEPLAKLFVINPSVWTRYWAEVNFETRTFSLWLADEERDAVGVYRDASVPKIDGLDEFWIELNSSQKRTGPQGTIGHFRNLIIQHNGEFTFERPKGVE